MFEKIVSGVLGMQVRAAEIDHSGWLVLDLCSRTSSWAGLPHRADLTLLVNHLSEDQPVWLPATTQRLVGRRICQVSSFGVAPEILVTFDTGLLLASFAIDGGNPSWLLVPRRKPMPFEPQPEAYSWTASQH